MAHQRILVFSPYASWHYHTQIELTLGRALRERKAEVLVLACDGLFPACDVHRKNLNPRRASSCNQCQATTAALMAENHGQFQWLSRFVPHALIHRAKAWVQGLGPQQLNGARWNDRPVAEWALSSALYQQRRAHPPWQDEEFQATFREQLLGTVLAFEGACAAFDEFQPDLMLTLNGRFFAHRAAIEVARERGVRFVTHERGMLKNTVTLHDNELKHELDGDRKLWAEQRGEPLSVELIDAVERVLHERRFGKGMSWSVRYSPLPQEREALIAKLGLDARPIVALFTSSEDEQATFPQWSQGAFQDGRDWLEATVELARGTPSHQFVIRMHPALASMGSNVAALEHAADLALRLPENCRVVAPKDDVSSYTLADAAELTIVYYTTMALEMAARGKRVMCVAAGWYAHAGFAEFVQRPEEYAPAVRACLGKAPDVETARQALRFANCVFARWSLPFALVVEEPMHRGQRTYTSGADLRPGRDLVLDRICNFLLEGTPLFAPCDLGDLEQRTALETARIEASLGLREAVAARDAHVLILEAEAAFEAGRAEQACELLLAALEQNPSATRAWQDLAAILEATGHPADAALALARVR